MYIVHIAHSTHTKKNLTFTMTRIGVFSSCLLFLFPFVSFQSFFPYDFCLLVCYTLCAVYVCVSVFFARWMRAIAKFVTANSCACVLYTWWIYSFFLLLLLLIDVDFRDDRRNCGKKIITATTPVDNTLHTPKTQSHKKNVIKNKIITNEINERTNEILFYNYFSEKNTSEKWIKKSDKNLQCYVWITKIFTAKWNERVSKREREREKSKIKHDKKWQ